MGRWEAGTGQCGPQAVSGGCPGGIWDGFLGEGARVSRAMALAGRPLCAKAETAGSPSPQAPTLAAPSILLSVDGHRTRPC